MFILFCVSIQLFGNDIGSKKEHKKLSSDIKKIESLLSIKNFKHNKKPKKFLHQVHSGNQESGNYKFLDASSSKNLEKIKTTTLPIPKSEVFAWYPYWEQEAYKYIHYNVLKTIAYFSYEVDPTTGNPVTIHDWETTPLIDSAKNNGVNILLTVTNFGESSNRSFLKNKNARTTCINKLIALIKKRKTQGVCLDFEGIAEGQKDDFTAFVQELRKAFDASEKGLMIYVAVPGVDFDKCFDFKAIIPAINSIVIMGYNYYGEQSKVAGPADPLKSGKVWDPANLSTSVDYYLANNIPADKLILALPFYGNLWDTNTDELASKGAFIGTRTFDYIREIGLEKKYEVRFDENSKCTWSGFKHNDKYRQCWYDNAKAFQLKIDLINKKHIRGLGIWALGYGTGNTEIWRIIASKLNTGVVANNTTSITTGDISDNSVTDSSLIASNLSVDSVSTSTEPNMFSGIIKELKNIDALLKPVTEHQTIALYIIGLSVVYGGIAIICAMFFADTRALLLGTNAKAIYTLILMLVLIILFFEMIGLIRDNTIALIMGFVLGATALYILLKSINHLKKDLP